MNIQEMHRWFNLILDSYNEPYFTEDEIDLLINVGGLELVNDIVFPDHNNVVSQNDTGRLTTNSIDGSKQTSEILAPLSYNILVNADPLVVKYSDINESLKQRILLSTGVEELDAEVMHIQYIHQRAPGAPKTPVTLVRKNDRLRFENNVFKKPTVENPVAEYSNGGLVFSNYNWHNQYEMAVIKKPRTVSLINNISSDLPSNVHPKVIAYALSSAGVANRDDVMLQLQKVSGNGTDRQ